METTDTPVSEWIVEGMTCTNCAMGVRRTLEKQGLSGVDVNFATGEVRFENGVGRNPQDIKGSIEELGYSVVKTDQAEDQKKNF